MSIYTYSINGNKVYLETGRPLSGGVAHTDLNTLLSNLVATTAPVFTPITLANAGTSNLNSGLTVFQTTANGTISGAVINVPVSANDGTQITISATGAVTTVTGTISYANTVLPPISSLAAGVVQQLSFNKASGKWFHT